MGETFVMKLPLPEARRSADWPVSALNPDPALELAAGEDPIECETVKRHGCAFWRGEWHTCSAGHEARVTAREFGYGGPGYCFFEMRCATTYVRTTRQGWYLNWRKFTPIQGMRLIADYRSDTDGRSQNAAGHEVYS